MIGNIVNQSSSGSSSGGNNENFDILNGSISFTSTSTGAQFTTDTVYFNNTSSYISFTNGLSFRYVILSSSNLDNEIKINLISNSINYLNTKYNLESYFHINYAGGAVTYNVDLAVFYGLISDKNTLTVKINGSASKYFVYGGSDTLSLNYIAVQ